MLTIPTAIELLAKWGPVAYNKAVELHKLWKAKRDPSDEQWGILEERIISTNYDEPVNKSEGGIK